MSVTTGTRGFHNTYNFGTGKRTASICLQLFNSCGKRHFALLPVSHVIVHALSEGSTVLSVDFERRIFTKLRFQGSDASDLVEEFKCNMNYDSQNGFQPVAQLEG